MRVLAVIGALAIVIGLIAGVFFFAGFYNVSAAADEPGPLAWALTNVRMASIKRHKEIAQAPFALEDVSVVQEGARQFANDGCVNCHGAPGVKWAKFSEGINPGPPDLKDVANELSAAGIFWVVKNGIRMTGMPSFSKVGLTDAQLWQLTAFVKSIPKISEADYRTWTAGTTK
jgi:mono/diheme cytochrome c family protein